MIAIEITDMLLKFIYDQKLHENNFISSSLIQRFMKIIEQYSNDLHHHHHRSSASNTSSSNNNYHQTNYYNYYYHNYNNIHHNNYHIFDGLQISSLLLFPQNSTNNIYDNIHNINNNNNIDDDDDEF